MFYIQVTCNFQYQYLLTKKECQSILDYCVDLKAFVKEKSSSNSFQTLRLNEVSGILYTVWGAVGFLLLYIDQFRRYYDSCSEFHSKCYVLAHIAKCANYLKINCGM